MKVTYWKGMGGVCENCGKPIKNVYVIEDEGLHFKCGSECVKNYLTVNDAGAKFIQSEVKKAQKYLDKKSTLEKGLEASDFELLRTTLRDSREEDVIIKEARKWIDICEARANKIYEELNVKLKKSNVQLKNTKKV